MPQVWDIAMESRPVRVIPVHEFLRSKLVELHDTDCIFDKFEVSTGGRDGSSFVTGSYSNSVKIYDTVAGSETTLELAKGRPRVPQVRPIVGGSAADNAPSHSSLAMLTDDGAGAGASAAFEAPRISADDFAKKAPHCAPPISADDIDISKKALHFSWHPFEDIIAICGLNNLYVYHV
jgi:serine/threonine-protein phosphatase 2A regulatory subunit B